MTYTELLAVSAIAVGCVFFLAGSIGMLRFPDVFTRLHAATKADNIGLGFLLVGVGIMMGSAGVAAKLFLIWILVMISGATTCNLIASRALAHVREPRNSP